MRKILCTFVSLCSVLTAGAKQYRSQVWCPDNGDGTYKSAVQDLNIQIKR